MKLHTEVIALEAIDQLPTLAEGGRAQHQAIQVFEVETQPPFQGAERPDVNAEETIQRGRAALAQRTAVRHVEVDL